MIAAGIIAQIIVNGVFLGGLYIIIAVGLNLVYGIMGLINYAHGEFMMVGMYMTYFLFTFSKIDPYLLLPLIFLILFAVGALTQYAVLNPLFKLPYEAQVITFVGLIYVIQNLVLIIWSPDYRNVLVPWASEAVDMLGVMIPFGRLAAAVVSLFITLILYLFIKKTRMGRAIRATSQEPLGASLIGINIQRVRVFTFALGVGLVGAAGVMFLPLYYVYPYAGAQFGILALIIITLGGLGNFVGTILGSVIIGLTEATVGVLFSSEIATAAAFLLFIVILMLRPAGIMSK
jgi:branched-chain amino acid transport system permease protein